MSGLWGGLEAGVKAGVVMGLGHGLFSWNADNIIPTGLIVLVVCVGVGVGGGWLFGYWEDAGDRKERAIEERKRAAESATREATRQAEIAAYNAPRQQDGHKIDEVVSSLVELYRRRGDMTDVLWQDALLAWQSKYSMRRVTGEGTVENVKMNYGLQGNVILLLDRSGLKYRYSAGASEGHLLRLPKGSSLRFDGKLHAAWSEEHLRKLVWSTSLNLEEMFLIAGWK